MRPAHGHRARLCGAPTAPGGRHAHRPHRRRRAGLRAAAAPAPACCSATGRARRWPVAGLLVSLVGRGVTLLAFDQRGLGASGPAPAPTTWPACAADALGLLDAVGWDTAAVVGVSFGGMVAQELAVTAPDRVERLALLCTSAGGAGGSSYPLHELEALDPGRAGRGRAAAARRPVRRGLARRPPGRPGPRRPAGRPTGPDEDPDVAAGRRAQLEARRGPRRLGPARRGHLPDAAWPAAATTRSPRWPTREAIASRIPGAELHVYEGGHAFFAQDRRAVADLAAFLHADGT